MFVIRRIDVRDLVEHTPLVPRRKWICGMKKRVIIRSQRGRREGYAKKKDSAAKKSGAAHDYVSMDPES
jgi:hypothetical protein